MTTTTTQAQAQENTISATTTNPTLSSECVIFGKAKIQGSCGKITLPKEVTEVKISGQDVTNTNIKSGELTWLPSKAVVKGNSISTRISSTYSNRVAKEFKLHGVNVGGLNLVPISALPELEKALEASKNEYWEKVDEIECFFDEIINFHKQENPEIATFIEEYKLTKEQWKGKHFFDIPAPLAVTPYREEDIVEMAETALDSLYNELADYAMSTYKQTFIERNGASKIKVSNKCRSPFKKMIKKITNLSFLDKGLLKIVDTLNEIMDEMPLSGYMSLAQYERLSKWCLIMSDPELLKLHSNGSNQEKLVEIAVEEEKDVFESFNSSKSAKENVVEVVEEENVDDAFNAFDTTSEPTPETAFEPKPSQEKNQVSFGSFDW